MTPKDCVQALERIVPMKLAGDWDNVGLLVEGPASRRVRRALLTIDFTETVLAEAVEKMSTLSLRTIPPSSAASSV